MNEPHKNCSIFNCFWIYANSTFKIDLPSFPIVIGLTGGDGIKERGRLIIGTNCNDKIKGNNKDEIIYTLAGTDKVFAKGGNDIIYGGSGTDRLYGEKGDDIINAGAGGNLLDGGPGNDVLAGGVGNDLMVEEKIMTSC